MTLDPWAELEAERLAVADLLATLSPEELDLPSLCAGWRIRDVAGHLYWVASARTPDIVRDVLLAGGRPHRMIRDQGVAAGSMAPDKLVERLRATAGSRLLSPGMRPVGYLADAIVHHQDMVRPLGRRRSVAAAPLVAVLDHYTGRDSFTGGRRRTKGLTLRATDVDWHRGQGPEVRGPGLSVLLAAVGRRAALEDLDGEGVTLLSSRIPGEGGLQ